MRYNDIPEYARNEIGRAKGSALVVAEKYGVSTSLVYRCRCEVNNKDFDGAVWVVPKWVLEQIAKSKS